MPKFKILNAMFRRILHYKCDFPYLFRILPTSFVKWSVKKAKKTSTPFGSQQHCDSLEFFWWNMFFVFDSLMQSILLSLSSQHRTMQFLSLHRNSWYFTRSQIAINLQVVLKFLWPFFLYVFFSIRFGTSFCTNTYTFVVISVHILIAILLPVHSFSPVFFVIWCLILWVGAAKKHYVWTQIQRFCSFFILLFIYWNEIEHHSK